MPDSNHPSRFLESDWGGADVWPFIEDENANVTGYGHQNFDDFAAAVTHYDRHCTGDADLEAVTADEISHGWLRLRLDGERMELCEPDAPGAFPATFLWGR